PPTTTPTFSTSSTTTTRPPTTTTTSTTSSTTTTRPPTTTTTSSTTTTTQPCQCHDVCTAGPAQCATGCDPCVADVCDQDPNCCDPTLGWTEFCVAEAASLDRKSVV